MWKCNVCGHLFISRIDAAICHPDVVEVDDDYSPSRSAEQRNEAVNAGQICPVCDGKGYVEWELLVVRCRNCNETGHI